MESGLDRGDCLLGNLVAAVESAEDDAFGVGFGGVDFAALDARRDESHADRGVWLAGREVFAGDGEVERVAVKCLTVDLDGSCCDHINVFG